jgi:hypothetical protein
MEDFTLAEARKIANSPRAMHRYLPLVLIVGLLIAFRIVGSVFHNALPNFQPLAALFFCGAMLAPGWRGLAIPIGIWAVTYPFDVGQHFDFQIFITTLIALGVTFLMGKGFAQKGIPTLLIGSVAAAVVFHLITNTAAWLGDPMYEKSLTGFWQSVWTGPALSKIPTWVFLRNLAAANVIFTGIFALAQLRLPKAEVTASAPVFAK